MKNIFKLILLTLLLPFTAFADDNVMRNDNAAIAMNRSNQQAGSLAVDAYGVLYVQYSDSVTGEEGSVVPVSSAAGLNGGLVIPNATFDVGTDTIEAASTTTVLNLTAHAAREGDIITPTGGTAANVDVSISVCATTTNTVTLCHPLPATPSTDAIVIRREKPIHAPKEDAAHVSGDTGFATWGVANTNATALAAEGDYTPQAVNLAGATFVDIKRSLQVSDAGSLLKAEDAAHTTGDAGAPSFGVRNTALTSPAADGDYTFLATGTAGELLSTIVYDSTLSGTANSPVTREDLAFGADHSLLMAGGQSLSAVAQSVGSSGDAAPRAQDLANRTLVTAAPSGQMVTGCNSAITTATTGSMIAAVASQFTFITSWNCTNTGGAATRVILEDSDGTDLANLLLAATTGNASVTFPTPVKTNVVNRAIQVNVITTGTSTICCASGYTGVI